MKSEVWRDFLGRRLLPSPDAGAFYGVTDPGDLAWMADRLTGHDLMITEPRAVAGALLEIAAA